MLTPPARLRALPFGMTAIVIAAAYTAPLYAADKSPEASDPNVAQCALMADRRLAGGGFGGAMAAGPAPKRADACVLKWQQPFNGEKKAKKVATLIVVPIEVELLTPSSQRKATLYARCGFNDSKLMAVEIVDKNKDC